MAIGGDKKAADLREQLRDWIDKADQAVESMTDEQIQLIQVTYGTVITVARLFATRFSGEDEAAKWIRALLKRIADAV